MKEVFFFVHLYNDFSGSPRVLKELIDLYSGNKFLFTSQHDGFLENKNCSKFIVPYRRANNKYAVLFYYLINQAYLFLVLFFFLTKMRVKGKKVTVVVNTLLPFSASLVSKIFGVKCVSYIHECYISPPILLKFLRFISSKCSSKIIYVSKFLRDETNIKHPNSYIIYNPLPREYEENLEIDVPICERYNDKRVLMVGSLKTYKGIFQFLKVAEKCPSYTFCLVVNSDDNEFNDFKKKTYIPSNVEVIVRPDNLPEIYKSSMVLLNLTLPDLCKETFGLTVIEGLSKGCPAIVPPTGGPVEITNNDCAFIVDPYDIKKLVDTLNILLGDPILWHRMSTASLLQSKKFSIKSYQSNIKNIIFEN